MGNYTHTLLQQEASFGLPTLVSGLLSTLSCRDYVSFVSSKVWTLVDFVLGFPCRAFGLSRLWRFRCCGVVLVGSSMTVLIVDQAPDYVFSLLVYKANFSGHTVLDRFSCSRLSE